MAEISTFRSMGDKIKHDGASAVAEKLRANYLEAAKPLLLLDTSVLAFCVYKEQHGRPVIARMDLKAIIIPRVFDAPFLKRIVLTEDGVFECPYCDCRAVPALSRVQHFNFSIMEEFSPEAYWNGMETLFGGIELLLGKTASPCGLSA